MKQNTKIIRRTPGWDLTLFSRTPTFCWLYLAITPEGQSDRYGGCGWSVQLWKPSHAWNKGRNEPPNHLNEDHSANASVPLLSLTTLDRYRERNFLHLSQDISKCLSHYCRHYILVFVLGYNVNNINVFSDFYNLTVTVEMSAQIHLLHFLTSHDQILVACFHAGSKSLLLPDP